MVEGGRLESGYPGKPGSWVRIPLSPPCFAQESFAWRTPTRKASAHKSQFFKTIRKQFKNFGKNKLICYLICQDRKVAAGVTGFCVLPFLLNYSPLFSKKAIIENSGLSYFRQR